jgi:hypothetical protein
MTLSMRRTTVKIRHLPLPLLFSLALVACGSDADSNSAPPTTVTPATDAPTTDAPTTVPPTTVPPTTVAPTGLPAVDVEIDYEPHASIDDLVGDSDLVVIGTVTDAHSLGRPFLAQDPSAHEFVAYTVHVDEHLAGDPVDSVTLAWDAFTVGAGGERTGEVVLSGVRAPRVGDTVLLFLQPADPTLAAVVGGTPTHQPAALDGVVYVAAGAGVEGDVDSPAFAQMQGRSIEDLRAVVLAAASRA